MLEKIKLALRYKNNLFDNEITMYINACRNNLVLAGISKDKIIDTDDTILNVIVCYCKWQLNFQGNGEKWEKVYKDLKTALALDANYCVH